MRDFCKSLMARPNPAGEKESPDPSWAWALCLRSSGDPSSKTLGYLWPKIPPFVPLYISLGVVDSEYCPGSEKSFLEA